MRTLILCGGRGTRAYPHTLDVPKPLLPVGDRPVLEHVMSIYAAQGWCDFVLAAGYRHEMVSDWAATAPDAWRVDVVDTGEETGTGGRIRLCADLLGERFFATYADGLGNVDLTALLAFHEAHGRTATMTSVPLPSQYGTLELGPDGAVRRFREKPRLPDHLINAGFFVFDHAVFDVWAGDDLERDVLPALGSAGELFAYRHGGFWKSMDTYKDGQELSALCMSGDGPWLELPHAASLACDTAEP